MPSWSHHLEALARAISPLKAEPSGDTVANVAVVDERADAPVQGELGSPPETVDQALIQGMEVTLGDLDETAHGWMFRGHPVMVFAVDVAAVEDPQVRKEFYHRVHLASCCGALEDPAQVVWIGTARSNLSAPGLEQPPHACEYCLAKVNHRGFRALAPRDRGKVASALSFHWHVNQYAREFFPSDVTSFWTPGKAPQRLQQMVPSASAQSGNCGFCEWQVPEPEDGEESWFVPVERGVELGLAFDACVLCAQQQAAGVLILPDEHALEASRVRFEQQRLKARAFEGEGSSANETVVAAADGGEERSWHSVRSRLPLAWHPLCELLERNLAAPVLFHRFAGYEGIAVLAWPEHRRGIVAHSSERERLPEGWDFWDKASVLASLG